MKTQGIKNKTTKNNKKDIEEKRLDELKAVSVYMEQKLHIQIKTIKTELGLKSDNQAIIYLLGKGIQSFSENKNEITDEFLEVKSQLNKIINQNENTLKGIHGIKGMLNRGFTEIFGYSTGILWKLFLMKVEDGKKDLEKEKAECQGYLDHYKARVPNILLGKEKDEERNF